MRIPANLSIIRPYDPVLALVPGSKPGMIHDGVGNLYNGKKGVLFIPAAYRRRNLQWEYQEGVVKDWGIDPTILYLLGPPNQDGEYCAENGRIIPIAEYRGLMLLDDCLDCEDSVTVTLQLSGGDRDLLAFSFNAKITSLVGRLKGKVLTAPCFYRSYRLSVAWGDWNHSLPTWQWEISEGPFLSSLDFDGLTYEGQPVDCTRHGVLENGERFYLAARKLRQDTLREWEEAKAEK